MMEEREQPAEEKLREECGVIGVYDLDGNPVAGEIYYGLFALQHRGQESCGIAESMLTRGWGCATRHLPLRFWKG